MHSEDEMPDDALEQMSLLIGVVKGYLKWVAICVPILTILIASPLLKRTEVKLIPQNPMFVVDAKQFGQALLDEVAKSNVNAAIVDKLNKSLGAKLGETGGKFVFFREWYHPVTPVKYPIAGISTNIEELSLRGGLSQRKNWLGYDDPDTRFHFGIASTIGGNIYSLDELLRDPMLLHMEIELRYTWSDPSARFGNSSMLYTHDPFYADIETLSWREKNIVYWCLAGATQSYSVFIVANQGSYDEYDVRITANINAGDVDSNVLSTCSILIDQVVRDSVRFKIPNLAPGPKNYKILVINRGSMSDPVRAEEVRLDEKPLLVQITDSYRWFLVVPAIFTFADVGITILKRKRGQKSEDLIHI